MNNNISILTPYITGLVEQKRAYGIKYEEQEKLLKNFEAMFIEKYPNAETITQEITEIWAKRKPHEKIATVRHRTTPVKHLAQYMNSLGKSAYVFRTNEIGKEEKYSAHIYTDDELSRFFKATDECCYSPEVPYRHLTMPLLFRMIYCCGLRPGEATRMKVCDVDLNEGTLKILSSKYDSDRIVPMSLSLWEMCKSYSLIVHKKSDSTAPYFPGYQNKPITIDNLNSNFRRFLYKAGISHGGPGKGPRIYDFRHTFAVNCLKGLVLKGANMNSYYPVLKTYMGHSFFKYTAYYLKLTKNMYPDICEKMVSSLGDIIPTYGGNDNE